MKERQANTHRYDFDIEMEAVIASKTLHYPWIANVRSLRISQKARQNTHPLQRQPGINVFFFTFLMNSISS